MLIGYFDDSGTHANSEIIVWAGFVGSEDQWAVLDTMWQSKLTAPLPGKLPLRRFHMTSCEARIEEFVGYSEPEKDVLIHDFRQIIIDSGVVGRAFAVDRNEWDRKVTGVYRMLFGDAECFCFRACVSFAIAQAREHLTDRELTLVFDDRPHRAGVHELVANEFKKLYNGDPAFPTYPHLRDVSYKSSYVERPLQAADMLAWETYRVAHRTFRTGKTELRPHIQRLVDTGRVTAGFADHKTIEGLVSMFDVTPRESV